MIKDEESFTVRKDSEFVADPNRIYIVCHIHRPGSMSFMTALEWRHFDPEGCMVEGRRHLNDQYELVIKTWSGLTYAMISVPESYKKEVWKVAEDYGMKLAEGIPRLITSEGFDSFPFDGPDFYTLENKSGSKVYSADNQKLLNAERSMIDDIQVREKNYSPVG